MWWELCQGSSQCLLDIWGENASWQAAKKHFQSKGYVGRFILIHRSKTGFKLYNVNIKEAA